MSKFTIFKEEYSDIFTIYGYSVDTFGMILHSLNYNLKNMHTKKAREEAINAIEQLLEYNIIFVTHWGEHQSIIKKLDLDIHQTISYIKEVWFEGAKSIDIESMVTFGYEDWYLEKMEELKINEKTDWEWFDKKFVPNMKKWIEENRPKE